MEVITNSWDSTKKIIKEAIFSWDNNIIIGFAFIMLFDLETIFIGFRIFMVFRDIVNHNI